MNARKFHYIMIGVTCFLGVMILVSVFFANSILKQRSKKLYELKLQNQVLNQQQIGLSKAKRDIAKYSELDREAKLIVPQDKDQAAAVRELVKIAKSNGISISSVQFPISNLGTTAPGASGSTTTPSTGTTTPSTSGGATTNKPTVSQTQPVTGLKGVFTMPITVQVANDPVPYSNFISFLAKLEQNRRTAQVTSVNIQPIATNPNLINFTIIVNAYIKP